MSAKSQRSNEILNYFTVKFNYTDRTCSEEADLKEARILNESMALEIEKFVKEKFNIELFIHDKTSEI